MTELLAVPAVPLVTCPWCPTFNRWDPRHLGVSHGICGPCSQLLLAQMLAGR